MTYNVYGGTFNLAQSIYTLCSNEDFWKLELYHTSSDFAYSW